MYIPNYKDKYSLAKAYGCDCLTEKDEIRIDKAFRLYLDGIAANAANDWTLVFKGMGFMGAIAELLTATPNSAKAHVSNSGKHDNYIRFKNADGVIYPVPVERKTNGGRIETVESEYSKAEKMTGKYIVYSMDICNSTTNNIRRKAPAIIVPKKVFLDTLYRLNAVKAVRHKGEINGYAIQVSNKKWFEWVCAYPVKYDREKVYSDEDFRGVK